MPRHATGPNSRQGKLDVALDYAARGYAVFPCLPNSKQPALPGGFKNGTTNPATVRRWWLACPDYNIGIRTGIASGLWVFDADGDIGTTALAKLEAEYGPLPDTLISVTSKGCHFWFRYTGPTPCSVGRIGPGLDVRGDGGYVLAPPSVHPAGPRYRWTNNRPLAVAPDWLAALARKPVPKPITNKIALPARPLGSGTYGKAALDYEAAELANTLKGSRNHALNRASFRLHQLVAGGELHAAEVRHRLLQAATANGLIDDDGPLSVQKTIASGARAGLQRPRNRGGAA
jgi:hypothetical protein